MDELLADFCLEYIENNLDINDIPIKEEYDGQCRDISTNIGFNKTIAMDEALFNFIKSLQDIWSKISEILLKLHVKFIQTVSLMIMTSSSCNTPYIVLRIDILFPESSTLNT